MDTPNASTSKEMSLALSSDAKPRLKWTSELHQRFSDAVNRLGGAEKATPKSLMRVMGVHGLTLYHLKSHLQKYRLGKSQPSQTNHQNKQEDSGESRRSHFTSKMSDGATEHVNDNLQIAQALQMQMEVQRKLHEQIEVQRHLQLRIEAQGKYLQSVLRKAQETISGYGSHTIEVEQAKVQLSELVSMVDSGCPSSSFSVLTESEGSMLGHKLLGHNGCSLESSLTSSEREETPPKQHEDDTFHNGDNRKRNFVLLPLIETHTAETSGEETQSSHNKRSKNIIDNVSHTEQNVNEVSGEQSSQERVQRLNIDLNLNDFDSGSPEVIDLNGKEH